MPIYDDCVNSPSATAWRVARMRAVHQVRDGSTIFADPFALRIVDGAAEPDAAETPQSARYRAFIAARSRVAEDALRAARARGVRQVVVLGAGLDTTGLRHGAAVDVFEVDRAAMQHWKRAHLARVGISPPAGLRFVPVDFERDDLGEALAAAGMRADLPVFFVWLGVVPYLTSAAIRKTLRFAAEFPTAEIVFDYACHAAGLPPEMRAFMEQRAAAVAALGEAWVSYFELDQMAAMLRDAGFSRVCDWDAVELLTRFGCEMPAGSRSAGRIAHAARNE